MDFLLPVVARIDIPVVPMSNDALAAERAQVENELVFQRLVAMRVGDSNFELLV